MKKTNSEIKKDIISNNIEKYASLFDVDIKKYQKKDLIDKLDIKITKELINIRTLIEMIKDDDDDLSIQLNDDNFEINYHLINDGLLDDLLVRNIYSINERKSERVTNFKYDMADEIEEYHIEYNHHNNNKNYLDIVIDINRFLKSINPNARLSEELVSSFYIKCPLITEKFLEEFKIDDSKKFVELINKRMEFQIKVFDDKFDDGYFYWNNKIAYSADSMSLLLKNHKNENIENLNQYLINLNLHKYIHSSLENNTLFEFIHNKIKNGELNENLYSFFISKNIFKDLNFLKNDLNISIENIYKILTFNFAFYKKEQYLNENIFFNKIFDLNDKELAKEIIILYINESNKYNYKLNNGGYPISDGKLINDTLSCFNVDIKSDDIEIYKRYFRNMSHDINDLHLYQKMKNYFQIDNGNIINNFYLYEYLCAVIKEFNKETKKIKDNNAIENKELLYKYTNRISNIFNVFNKNNDFNFETSFHKFKIRKNLALKNVFMYPEQNNIKIIEDETVDLNETKQSLEIYTSFLDMFEDSVLRYKMYSIFSETNKDEDYLKYNIEFYDIYTKNKHLNHEIKLNQLLLFPLSSSIIKRIDYFKDAKSLKENDTKDNFDNDSLLLKVEKEFLLYDRVSKEYYDKKKNEWLLNDNVVTILKKNLSNFSDENEVFNDLKNRNLLNNMDDIFYVSHGGKLDFETLQYFLNTIKVDLKNIKFHEKSFFERLIESKFTTQNNVTKVFELVCKEIGKKTFKLSELHSISENNSDIGLILINYINKNIKQIDLHKIYKGESVISSLCTSFFSKNSSTDKNEILFFLKDLDDRLFENVTIDNSFLKNESDTQNVLRVVDEKINFSKIIRLLIMNLSHFKDNDIDELQFSLISKYINCINNNKINIFNKTEYLYKNIFSETLISKFNDERLNKLFNFLMNNNETKNTLMDIMFRKYDTNYNSEFSSKFIDFLIKERNKLFKDNKIIITVQKNENVNNLSYTSFRSEVYNYIKENENLYDVFNEDNQEKSIKLPLTNLVAIQYFENKIKPPTESLNFDTNDVLKLLNKMGDGFLQYQHLTYLLVHLTNFNEKFNKEFAVDFEFLGKVKENIVQCYNTNNLNNNEDKLIIDNLINNFNKNVINEYLNINNQNKVKKIKL